VLLSACAENRGATNDPARPAPATAGAHFDGADYSTEAEKIAHGERVATLLGCNACHGEDYSGVNFGEIIPIVDGLWTTNISRTLPKMSDGEIERLLREGVHPTREMYLMPSKQSQFVSERDMEALIAYLRTIEPTPPPPPGFEEAVTARPTITGARRRRASPGGIITRPRKPHISPRTRSPTSATTMRRAGWWCRRSAPPATEPPWTGWANQQAG
jgi:cytochrome c553